MAACLNVYDTVYSAIFDSAEKKFAGFSNNALGYPLTVNGHAIETCEALYQACRFPKNPELQEAIINQNTVSGIGAIVKKNVNLNRQDWQSARVKIMEWCFRVKVALNYDSMAVLFYETGSKSIVKYSNNDSFFGAKQIDYNKLQGCNVLGFLIMKVRKEFFSNDREVLEYVKPLAIPDFLLFGEPIQAVDGRK